MVVVLLLAALVPECCSVADWFSLALDPVMETFSGFAFFGLTASGWLRRADEESVVA
jgi:hypothetical protein